jgi:AraC-like DNA-binding protein
MAYTTQKDQRRYIEFNNLVVDYTDGDVIVYDNIQNVAALYPLKPMTNMIVMCLSGNMTMKVNDTRNMVKEGDIFCCPPNVRIANTDISNDFACHVICLSDHIIQGLLHDRINTWHRAVYVVNKLTIINLPNEIQQEFDLYYKLIGMKLQNRQTAPYEIVQALVRAFLLEMCFMLEHTQGDNENVKLSQGKILFNRFLTLISNNEVKRQPISHYASLLAITPKYLTMLCLKHSDKTASEWIIQYTTEDIRFYLKNSNLSIKEISAKLGFANMSHFGSYVRKHLGMSPSEFRHR